MLTGKEILKKEKRGQELMISIIYLELLYTLAYKENDFWITKNAQFLHNQDIARHISGIRGTLHIQVNCATNTSL
jgi:hypothetical protein